MDPQANTTAEIPKNKDSSFKELVKFAILAIVIVFPIRTFIAQPFVVSGASMDPTFWDGEYLIVDEISYRFKEPERGEVIIFKYPLNPSKYFIKRIIGLPGETLVIRGDGVNISTADGQEIKWNEPYVDESNRQTYDNITVTLNNDEYYVLGDNRSGSSDSRVWGPVPRSYVIGRPFLRLMPPKKLSLFPGDYSQSE